MRPSLGVFLSFTLAACTACSGSDGDAAATADGGTPPLEDVATGADTPTDDTSTVVGDSTVVASDATAETTPADTSTKPGTSSAAAIATKLRGKPNFLIGLGNDLAANHDMDGAFTLGTTLDLHYTYLTGLGGSGGWPDWNAGGTFVNIITDSSAKHGVTPMFTLYQMAAWGEATSPASPTTDT